MPNGAIDHPVKVERGGVSLNGRVVWQHGSTAGMEFDEQINEHAFSPFPPRQPLLRAL
jgi:hypothetical protein